MSSYLAVCWSYALQLIAAPPPCAAVVPSVMPPEQPGVERETDGDADAANS